jgi:UPF0271 protein
MRPARHIDLNADVGEGCGFDDELVPLVSTANIACGAHAGDEATMRDAVALALRHGVAIGAHPGFADREHFGRREIPIGPAEAAELVIGQARVLQRVAAEAGARVGHVKLHGALYNMVSRDRALASAVAEALAEDVQRFGQEWVLIALAGSILASVARERGLTVLGEAFADRSYRSDGSLAPRSEAGAVIKDAGAAAAQALRIATEGTVRAGDGTVVTIDAATLCIHGDSAGAAELARLIRGEFARAGIEVRNPR